MLCQSVHKLPKRFSRESNQNSRYENFNTRTAEILQSTRILKANCCLKIQKTRMHSSRMRTVRCSGCRGCIPACTRQGGCLPMGGVCPELSAGGCLTREEGCLPGGVCPGEGGVFPGRVSATNPLPPWTE